jgi:NAD(P)H-hydrate repair Nnr-like enzyme with NAD(P)H-hydrate epimerase domain
MNGGDGFIVARVLREAGWSVRLGLLGALGDLCGDAALAASRWGGRVVAVSEAFLEDAGVAVDALFGAGLNRDLDGKAKPVVEAMQGRASTGG